MNMGLLELSARMAVGVAAPAVVPALGLENYIGVEGNVLVAVCLGSLGAIVFVKGKEPRKELYAVALGSVIIGCAITSLTALVVHAFYKVDLQPPHMASVGIVWGALMRFVMPALIEHVPTMIQNIRIPFLSKK